MLGSTFSCSGSRWSVTSLELGTREGERVLRKFYEIFFFKDKI